MTSLSGMSIGFFVMLFDSISMLLMVANLQVLSQN